MVLLIQYLTIPMRQFFSILLMFPLVLVLSACSTTQESSSSPTDPDIYTDTERGFTVSFPEGWEQDVYDDFNLVAFLSPPQGSSDRFQDNVNIQVQPARGRDTDLQDFLDTTLGELTTNLSNSQIREQTDTTLDGEPAIQLVYTGDQQDMQFKWLMTFAIHDGKAYVFSYTAEQTTYETFFSEAKGILDSFQFL